MSAMRAVFVFGLLSVLPLIFGDEIDNGITPSAEPATASDCPGRPSNAKPIEFKILFVQRIPSTKRPVTGPQPESEVTHSINLQGRQQIRNEDEYQSVFGTHSSGIDWSSYRIVVVPLVTVYKLDQLDSTVTLDGISQKEDAIYIGMTFTQIGPCQGMAQKDEWFARDQVNYFVLLPTKPERIIYYTCVINGCPPNIP
jgi:hypothetical protein